MADRRIDLRDRFSCLDVYEALSSRLDFSVDGPRIDGFSRKVFSTNEDGPGYFISQKVYSTTIGAGKPGDFSYMMVIDLSPDISRTGEISEVRCVRLGISWSELDQFQASILPTGNYLVDVSIVSSCGRWVFLKTLERSYYFELA